MKVRKYDVGKRCTVKFDDIGHVDAMILGGGVIEREWKVFVFPTETIDSVDTDHIVEIGERISPRQ